MKTTATPSPAQTPPAMNTQTPGPIETSVNSDNQWDVCEAGGGDMLADLAGMDNGGPNARLLASAYTAFDKAKTVTENNNVLTLTYGYDQQRRTSKLTTNSVTQREVVYLGNYEKIKQVNAFLV